jgi:tripartite-type tricarboxylate transporter receptor subunit TctC
MNIKILAHVFGATLMIFGATIAHAAENYPNRPIRMIDPYAPGGSTEAQARAIGQQLLLAWKQPVVIDARPGAGSAIGTQIVAKALPDGYTLLFTNAAFATVPNSSRNPLFDPIKDLAPVIQVGSQPLILVAHPSVPERLSEMLTYAKANPGKLNFGSAGTAGASHLAMELFKSMAAIHIVHVPYKGSSPSATALLSGEVQLGTFSANSVLPHIRTGKLKALGVSTLKRATVLPEVPTIAEAGVPGYEVVQWSGIFAPAGTPDVIINNLNRKVDEILKMSDVKERFAKLGVDPAGGSAKQFSEFVVADVRRWGRVIEKAGIPRE